MKPLDPMETARGLAESGPGRSTQAMPNYSGGNPLLRQGVRRLAQGPATSRAAMASLLARLDPALVAAAVAVTAVAGAS